MPEPTDKGSPDDPRRADESGEPGGSGRSHGHIVDRQTPEGETRPLKDEGDEQTPTERSEHWESGRQRAQ